MASEFLLYEEQEKNASHPGMDMRDLAVRRKEEGGRMRLKDLAEQWLANTKLRVKESSYVKYYNMVHNHIIPELGDIPLMELTTGRIEKFVDSKLNNGRGGRKKGLSEKTVKDIVTVLKEICGFAEKKDIRCPAVRNWYGSGQGRSKHRCWNL